MCDIQLKSKRSAFEDYLKIHNIEEILEDILHSL